VRDVSVVALDARFRGHDDLCVELVQSDV